MRIRSVDVPRKLIEAHRKGDLVIFVGAGASVDPPSGLPDFRRLAAAVAFDAGVDATDAELDRPDFLLGDLEDQRGINVHRRVAERLGVASSRPNRLHEAVAALACAGSTVRIVTTNYDPHLSTVLHKLGCARPEYMAPAL